MPTVIVDGNNVVGAGADGWWRDKKGAMRRLVGRLQGLQQATGDTVIVVLDVPQDDLPVGDNGGVEVVYPRRRGRNAADERIIELLDERQLTGPDVEVVTSDRELAEFARERQVPVTGAGSFLSRLRSLEG
jgi:predicted RNA-binding protein with PIN domain